MNNMGYSNSKLVSYTKLSPNNYGLRNHAIDTITIHCVVGQCSVETLGDVFAPTSRQASCNYGIGSDGRIGLYCEEKNRSWCTSSSSNDNRAITIEVASDTSEPYAVRDVVYKSLINLLVDICQRNGIKQLLWKADKSLIGQVDKQNMTVHRWFATKSCPGEWLYSRHGEIAKLVNERLGASETPVVTPPIDNSTSIKVGNKVKLVSGAKQYDGKAIASSYKTKEYVLKELKGDRAVLTIDGVIIYAVNVNSLVGTTIEPVKPNDGVVDVKDFLVKVTCDDLNIRSGPGTSCDIVGQIKDRGVYTITHEDSTENWGKLKSGAGWIHLGYTKRV